MVIVLLCVMLRKGFTLNEPEADIFASKSKLIFPNNPDDRQVLLQIKSSLKNPTHLDSWKPNADCCSWEGIQCGSSSNRVTTLQFDNANISGQLPPAIGNLPYLETLMINNCPRLTGSLPATLAKLTHLSHISISGTRISGPVPSFLSGLKNLTYIYLANNQFTGSIPSSLAQLTKLTVIHLNNNKLTGSIPDSFGEFTGNVPDIVLNHNQITGSIPKSMGNLNYSAIVLSENMLEGDASVLFGKNKTLRFAYLGRNKLSFDISKVEFPASLTTLELTHNSITGSLPASLARLDLTYLKVGYNKLCGKIPVGGRLQELHASAYLPNQCLCGAPLPKGGKGAGMQMDVCLRDVVALGLWMDVLGTGSLIMGGGVLYFPFCSLMIFVSPAIITQCRSGMRGLVLVFSQ
ncbi:hypothetical protein RJ640_010698 [Escallonia rubra]|uniref:Leucine-rich repeat-containing N-terminal plant-type domain-containing protein n=1 Tax=Escallonia rubra TaxID=112253 RepID=A0AA88R0I3_9ASTE|nr:hypothetical protein RJ640_010698 [Escallonia rubra]